MQMKPRESCVALPNMNNRVETTKIVHQIGCFGVPKRI